MGLPSGSKLSGSGTVRILGFRVATEGGNRFVTCTAVVLSIPSVIVLRSPGDCLPSGCSTIGPYPGTLHPNSGQPPHVPFLRVPAGKQQYRRSLGKKTSLGFWVLGLQGLGVVWGLGLIGRRNAYKVLLRVVCGFRI